MAPRKTTDLEGSVLSFMGYRKLNQHLDTHRKICFNSAMWTEFKDLCYQNDTTASEVLREQAERYVDQHRDKTNKTSQQTERTTP